MNEGNLIARINGLWDRLRPEVAAERGSHGKWEAGGQLLGSQNIVSEQAVARAFPAFPTFPSELGHTQTADLGDWAERAAIMEFDGGLDRAAAERMAAQAPDRQGYPGEVPSGS